MTNPPVTDGLMSRLQCTQNAAARLVPVLQELHWLPVRRRVDFKTTSTLVYLSLSSYLAADCQLLVSDEGRT